MFFVPLNYTKHMVRVRFLYGIEFLLMFKEAISDDDVTKLIEDLKKDDIRLPRISYNFIGIVHENALLNQFANSPFRFYDTIVTEVDDYDAVKGYKIVRPLDECEAAQVSAALDQASLKTLVDKVVEAVGVDKVGALGWYKIRLPR
jgi:hypothetical protein